MWNRNIYPLIKISTTVIYSVLDGWIMKLYRQNKLFYFGIKVYVGARGSEIMTENCCDDSTRDSNSINTLPGY